MTDLTTDPAPKELPESGTFPYATWGPWIGLGALVAAFVLTLMVSLPFAMLDDAPDPDDYTLFTVIAIQICQGISFIAVSIALALQGPGGLRGALSRLGFRSFDVGEGAKWIVLGGLAYVVFSILYSVVIGTPDQDDIASDFGPLPMQIFLIVILAPLTEEMLCRGVLFGGIRTRLPMWSAALAAGAVFGALHYSTGPSAVPPLIIFGAVLAVVYEKSGSLWPAIILHAMNNALALAVLNS